MTQSVLERTGEQIAETARKASRATSAVADALQDGVGAASVSQNKAATLPKSFSMKQSSACSGIQLRQLWRRSQ